MWLKAMLSRASLWLCLYLVISTGLVGCQLQQPEEATPSPSPTIPATLAPDPTPTVDVLSPLTPTPGGTIFPTGPITLTIWTTQQFTPSDEDPGGRLLLAQLLSFERSHPDVSVEVVVKRPVGPGGIMDYVEIASQVAPAVLPDITILSSEMLHQTASTGVIQPLDDILPPEVVEGLFPVANELGRMDGRLMGIPFTLNFHHLIYNTAIFSDSSPAGWTDILDSGGPYFFPADEDAPLNTTLGHYLAAGGTLYNGKGQPRLEIDPLTEVLRFYQRANQEHVIPVATLQTGSLETSWDIYRNGNALITHVDTALYLDRREELLNTAVAAIPGPKKPAPPLVSGWHWALATPDPARQRLAAELLGWLMVADNLGVWSYSSHWLPASEQALAAWPTDDEYVQFARGQILAALPYPADEFYQTLQPRLAQAVRDVLLGNASPAAAAADIIP